MAKRITNEDLAAMIQIGFESAGKNFKSEIGRLETKIDSVENRMDRIEHTVVKIERAQEDMLLRMDYLAPKFEITDLKKRVTKVEHRLNYPEESKLPKRPK